VWVKISALNGIKSASASIRATLSSALVLACLNRFGEMSMPIMCLVFLVTCGKNNPVPHPASSITAFSSIG